MNTVMPILSAENVGAICDFYEKNLGFDIGFKMSDSDGVVHTSALNFGAETVVMFTTMGDQPEGSRGLVLYFMTDDVDAYHASIAENDGVKIIEPPTDQFWGDRTCMVQDPFGNVLQFATHTGEMQAPPDGFTVEMVQPVG